MEPEHTRLHTYCHNDKTTTSTIIIIVIIITGAQVWHVLTSNDTALPVKHTFMLLPSYNSSLNFGQYQFHVLLTVGG